MNNPLVIETFSHHYLFPAIIICILSGICIYNIYGLVACIKRSKKYRTAIGMIIDGHEQLEKEKPSDKADGKILKSSLVEEQIKSNKKKIEKIKKERLHSDASFFMESANMTSSRRKLAEKNKKKDNHKEKARENQRMKKESRKNKGKQQNSSIESMLNMIYREDDFFDSVIGLYYEIQLPQISDPAVRERVLLKRKTREKIENKKERSSTRKKKKGKNAGEPVNKENDIKIFD